MKKLQKMRRKRNRKIIETESPFNFVHFHRNKVYVILMSFFGSSNSNKSRDGERKKLKYNNVAHV